MATYRTLSGAEKALSNFKRKDLKRECVIRGMDFQEASESSDPQLQSFFLKNFDEPPNIGLLTEYDAWLEKFLIEERGYDPKENNWAFHPHLKLGFLGDESVYESTQGEPIPKVRKQGRFKKSQTNKPKRKKDPKTGLMSGTKKSLTFELTKEKLPFNKILSKVMKAFPDANEKSVIIWYKKACKQNGIKPENISANRKKAEDDDVILIIEI